MPFGGGGQGRRPGVPVSPEDQWALELSLVPTLSCLPVPSGLGRALQVPEKWGCLKEGVLHRA